MTPEEKHKDAVEAAHEWRDEERSRNHVCGYTDGLPPEWLSDSPVTDPPKRSILRQLAEDPDCDLIEISPQIWWISKPRPDRDKLS